MTSERKQDAFVTEDDLTTTAPNIKADAWSMPAPVFRKTSGRLPESFVKHTPVIPPSEISETPDTSEAPNLLTPNPPVEAGPKSPTLKIVVVALAVAAMVAFIALFLTVVYFMFLR